MTNYSIFDLKIKHALENGYEIGICPFGEYGLELKNILNNRYGVEEKVLVDNYISRWNKKCRSIDELSDNDGNTIIILAIKNKAVREQLRTELEKKGYITDGLYEPSVYPSKDPDFLHQVVELLKTKMVRGGSYRRIGRENDGGYVMLDDFQSITAAYSFGIADDVSWDYDISSYGIDIYMYDPTIEDLPKMNDRFHFYKQGISGESETDDYKKLTTFLKNNKHSKEENLLLKIDVEGSEWEAFWALQSTDLKRFRQITGEFHNLCDGINQDIKLEVLKRLCETHQPIWIHGNNFDYAEVSDGVCMPNVLEITFVNKSFYDFEDGSNDEIKRLTTPNWALMEDFDMDNWRYPSLVPSMAKI